MKYRDAGVDIDRAADFVERIKAHTESTRRPGWMDGLGGFGALFRLDLGRWKKPVLVSSTDGVGTKLLLAQTAGRHHGVGIDLVAMSVNDILAQGAEPLFFLDYLATGVLDPETAVEIVAGIADGCRQSHCSLVGGETAEMPGFYPPGEYDLAGFAVGVAEEEQIVTGQGISPGDCIIGLASSGPHSNGYSLIRAVLGEDLKAALESPVPWGGGTLGEALLAPTIIYVDAILPLLPKGVVRGLSHITGGGLVDNLGRILPPGVDAHIDPAAWNVPPLFRFLQDRGGIEEQEMRRVFNLGLGFLIVAAAGSEKTILESVRERGYTPCAIGRIETGSGRVRFE